MSERREQVSAGLFTAAAGVGADPAVLVHVRVGVALGGACGARCAQRLQRGTKHGGVRAGVAREQARGGVAEVGAILVQTDAGGQIGDHLLAETGVGAGRTSLAALEARVDTGQERVSVGDVVGSGVGVEHLGGDGHGLLL